MRKVAAMLLLIVPLIAASPARLHSSAQKEELHWLTPAEALQAYAKEPRPFVIDLYTDWCGWCKVMDRETYSNKQVIAYISKNFYPVKYNAESKDSLIWNGRTFNYMAQYRTNEWAVYLTGGRLSYPTTVFLVEPGGQPAPLAGYLKVKEFEPPLRFFGDGAYKTQNYPTFMKTFSASW